MATSLVDRSDWVEADGWRMLQQAVLRQAEAEQGVHLVRGPADDFLPDGFHMVSDEEIRKAGHPVGYSAGDNLPDVEDESADVPANVEALLAIADLFDKMKQLAPLIRLTMYLFHGVFGYPRLNQPQIARLTGVSVATVSRRCAKGMTQLRELYDVAHLN
jgi:hypothetical protein